MSDKPNSQRSAVAPTFRSEPAGLRPGSTTSDTARMAVPPIEPERYEFFAPSAYHFEFDRREFFRIFGCGLVIVCVLPEASAFQESGRRGFGRGEQLPQKISAWLHIGENGTVTVNTGKVEMARTSAPRSPRPLLRSCAFRPVPFAW